MQRMYDSLAIALAIVALLGCLSACFYFVYHLAMIAICWWRDTPQRTWGQMCVFFRIPRGCITEKQISR
jgi:hypothetical protein